jgi:two-component sensor histidine kinase
VTVDVKIESVDLSIDLAVPCGMIVNELVTNAMEYAFPDGRTGNIGVVFRTVDGRCELTVSDDGAGLSIPGEDSPAEALGPRVVRALTQQIDATLQVESDGGTRCTISFGASSSPGSA